MLIWDTWSSQSQTDSRTAAARAGGQGNEGLLFRRSRLRFYKTSTEGVGVCEGDGQADAQQHGIRMDLPPLNSHLLRQ